MAKRQLVIVRGMRLPSCPKRSDDALVPLLRWRLTGMFEKGLAGIEAQVARLRSEAAPRPESVLTDSI